MRYVVHVAAKTFQIVRDSPAGFRPGKQYALVRELKRATSRARRRAERHDIENAPVTLRQVTRGWSD